MSEPQLQPAVLIGMNNPYGSDARYTLYPLPERSAGGRLFAMLQAARPQAKLTEYRDGFDRRNLVLGDWSDVVARENVPGLRRELDGRTILLLGAKVRDAFGCRPKEPFGAEARYNSETGRHTYWHWAPHPSGLNQMFNDPVNRRIMGRFLGRLLDGERGLLSFGLDKGSLTP